MKPVLQALIVADHVYQDQQTGKKVICGTFNSFRFSRKPPVSEVQNPDGTKRTVMMGGSQSGSPYAYVSLTDVFEGTKLLLRFVNLDEERSAVWDRSRGEQRPPAGHGRDGSSVAAAAHPGNRRLCIGTGVRRRHSWLLPDHGGEHGRKERRGSRRPQLANS